MAITIDYINSYINKVYKKKFIDSIFAPNLIELKLWRELRLAGIIKRIEKLIGWKRSRKRKDLLIVMGDKAYNDLSDVFDATATISTGGKGGINNMFYRDIPIECFNVKQGSDGIVLYKEVRRNK